MRTSATLEPQAGLSSALNILAELPGCRLSGSGGFTHCSTKNAAKPTEGQIQPGTMLRLEADKCIASSQ